MMQNNRLGDAAHMKKTFDILSSLHRKYLSELKDNEKLKPLVERADIKLKLAIELTGNSEEAMSRIKEALGKPV